MLPAQPNQSVLDGIACLQAVSSRKKPVGVRSLARELVLEPTRVNRLLKTLAHSGLVHQTTQGQYISGPGLHVLAGMSLQGSGLLTAALPSIRELAKEKLTVALGVLWHDQVCYLYHGHPGQPLELGIGSQELFPAVSSSIGQSILAHLSKSIRTKLPKPHSYNKIQKNGYALVEQQDGIRTLGTAIGNPPIAGIALAGRITSARIPGLVKRLKTAALNISQKLEKYHKT
jgi:DNA-binding IclR family transcriptional regulator